MDVVCPHPHPGTQTPENPGATSPSDLWVQNGLALRSPQPLWMHLGIFPWARLPHGQRPSGDSTRCRGSWQSGLFVRWVVME